MGVAAMDCSWSRFRYCARWWLLVVALQICYRSDLVCSLEDGDSCCSCGGFLAEKMVLP